MASTLTKESSILIVGGGTWGCSTALHLARRGYTNVTLLDVNYIPSPISAGHDVNKIASRLSKSSPPLSLTIQIPNLYRRAR